MAVLVGIDEAGYGPLLGPLVLASTTFHLPDEYAEADLWDVLLASVSQQKRRLLGRLLITDSKKAFSRSTGLGHLERTVLAAIKTWGGAAESLGSLIQTVCPDTSPRLSAYPWYTDLVSRTLPIDDPDKDIASAALKRDLEKHQMRLGAIHGVCLDVGHYNHMVEAVRNKSNVLFTAACNLIQMALRDAQGQALIIKVDRQGGRVHYRAHLQRMFPNVALTILHEDEQRSHYRMEGQQQTVDLEFKIKADQKHLPVSLASMVAKFIRELMMERINVYFQQYYSELAPTAGYWQDGQRFIKDLETHCPQVSIDRTRLIRCR